MWSKRNSCEGQNFRFMLFWGLALLTACHAVLPWTEAGLRDASLIAQESCHGARFFQKCSRCEFTCRSICFGILVRLWAGNFIIGPCLIKRVILPSVGVQTHLAKSCSYEQTERPEERQCNQDTLTHVTWGLKVTHSVCSQTLPPLGFEGKPQIKEWLQGSDYKKSNGDTACHKDTHTLRPSACRGTHKRVFGQSSMNK